MADFLTTSGTSYHLEKIIIDAKNNLVLVSPYLQISKTLFERLKDAVKRGVKVRIIYGKDELKPNEKNSLADLKNLELYYFENLHAKCFFNEAEMVITSMNIYEFSERTNREMGVLISRTADRDLFEKAVAEVTSITQSSEVIENRKVERRFATNSGTSTKSSSKIGYCIRCETRIPFNSTKPYCPDCYSVWAEYKNPDYTENVCHSCGEFEFTSLSKPLCYDCYKKSNHK